MLWFAFKETDRSIPKADSGNHNCKKLMRGTFSKCFSFWNKCSRSVQVNEKCKDQLENSVVLPNKTRWNSTFDAVNFLLKNKENLDLLFQAAEVPKLKSCEKDFLEGYMKALEPIASALDYFQGENLHFGCVIPRFLKTQRQLEDVVKTGCPYSTFIAHALLSSLKTRFNHILEVNQQLARSEILATVLLPRFKLGWVSENKREAIKSMFLAESKFFQGFCAQNQETGTESNVCDDGLLEFEITNTHHKSTEEEVELECMKYLQDPDKNLESVKKYPTIQRMFEKYNVVLPSSAPAERLFSYGKLVLTPQRGRLSDDMFERCVFLKLNKLR